MGSIGAARGTSNTVAQTYSTVDQRADEVQELLSSADYIGDRAIETQINSLIRGYGESAIVDSFNIISNENGGEFGTVEAEFHVNYRIPETNYDSDGYEYTTYSNETEYRTDTFRVRVKRR